MVLIQVELRAELISHVAEVLEEELVQLSNLFTFIFHAFRFLFRLAHPTLKHHQLLLYGCISLSQLVQPGVGLALSLVQIFEDGKHAVAVLAELVLESRN